MLKLDNIQKEFWCWNEFEDELCVCTYTKQRERFFRIYFYLHVFNYACTDQRYSKRIIRWSFLYHNFFFYLKNISLPFLLQSLTSPMLVVYFMQIIKTLEKFLIFMYLQRVFVKPKYIKQKLFLNLSRNFIFLFNLEK